MSFERDRLGVHSMGFDARDQRRWFTPDAAFPTITEGFAAAIEAYVRSLPPRWRLDGAALAFELVGTVLRPWWTAERARQTKTWRITARRRRGTRRTRRR